MRLSIILLVLTLASCATQTKMRDNSAVDQASWRNLVSQHPAGEALAELFPASPEPAPKDFSPTGLTRNDYLTLIAGNVDFWKQHQNDAGAIIDPYEKKERQ